VLVLLVSERFIFSSQWDEMKGKKACSLFKKKYNILAHVDASKDTHVALAARIETVQC
jgi:hypothetical protein